MRITNGMLVNNMMNNLNNNLNRLERYQNQGASGRKFDKPSDDPIGMSKSLKLYTDVSKVDQYERNLNDAKSWMHTTEEALKEVEEILQRARELSVDAANGTKTETDTKNIAEEIKQLKQQVIKLGNTRHAGRSIFTGFKTDQDLFKADGSYDISINKDDTSIYNVGISEDIEVNILGMKVFGSISDKDRVDYNLRGSTQIDSDNDSEEVKNTKTRRLDNLHAVKNQLMEPVLKTKLEALGFNVDGISSYNDLPKLPGDEAVINKIQEHFEMTVTTPVEEKDVDKLWSDIMHTHGRISVDLNKGFESSKSNINDTSSIMEMFDNIIDAMDIGDYEEINKQLAEIDKVHRNIISVKAEIGSKTNRLDMTEKRLSSEKLNFKDNLSKNEDVDYAELIMKSQLAQNVYQASLAIGAKVIQPSLMDFLR